MATNSPGGKNTVGALISDIFKRGLVDDVSSPFALIMKSGVSIGIEYDFITLNDPPHISNVNSDPGIPENPSSCSSAYSVRNCWKYANFVELTSAGPITNQAPFSFPVRRLLIFFPDFFMCDAVLHSKS